MNTAPATIATLPLLAGILLLAACGHAPVRAGHAPGVGPAGANVLNPTTAPVQTGIPACDAYLASYLACHQAAGIFAPDQLQQRYQAMRDSLLRDARDPDTRPQLPNRCAVLAEGMREALDGKSCGTTPPGPG
ncbi:hypothetical protein QMK61_15905 [Fulvimonas sp. R45]|uniref:hypothetical protein n=1 Tax=Fulvimonas sp. R45 TaxID=3045937 RepID=UPI00265F61CB|nr:hypothetical protein [Fulvimonas sp. R45]MDO1530322.1 hypothetical protein [Fulvimonas sp. R45]